MPVQNAAVMKVRSPGDDNPVPAPAPQPQSVTMCNKSGETMKVFWHDGKRGVLVGEVQPGRCMGQETYPGHIFIWTPAKGGGAEDTYKMKIEAGLREYEY